MQNSKIFSGTIPWTLVLGERKVCFRSPKLYQNSPTAATAMQNSKIFPGDNIPDPRFRGEKSLFLFSEIVPKLSHRCNSNAEFKNFPGAKPHTFVLGGVVFVL